MQEGELDNEQESIQKRHSKPANKKRYREDEQPVKRKYKESDDKVSSSEDIGKLNEIVSDYQEEQKARKGNISMSSSKSSLSSDWEKKMQKTEDYCKREKQIEIRRLTTAR